MALAVAAAVILHHAEITGEHQPAADGSAAWAPPDAVGCEDRMASRQSLLPQMVAAVQLFSVALLPKNSA